MSHIATNWAFQQRGLPPAAKLVLLCLADRHNPDHGCFPKQAHLAAECEMVRSTLNLHLAALEKAGLICREQRVDAATKQQMPTRYRFAFEPGFRPVHGAAPGSVQCKNPDDSAREDDESRVRNSDTGCGEPCPKKDESRVRLIGHVIAEPVSEPVRERESARGGAGPGASAGAVEPVAAQHDGEADAPSLDALRAGYPKAGYEPQQALGDAWEALTDAQQREALAGLAGYLAGARAGGRKYLPKAVDYLKNRLWTIPEARCATERGTGAARAEAAGYWSAEAWSKEWWALLFSRLERGAAVGLMLQWADQRRPAGCALAEKPDDAAIAGLRGYPSDGDVVARWRPWFEARGVRLRQFSGKFWVFLPGESPGVLPPRSSHASRPEAPNVPSRP